MYKRRIIYIPTKFAYFGVFAHVRRNTPYSYYDFVHIRTLKGFGVSAYIRRIILILTKFAYFGVSACTQKNSASLIRFCAYTHIEGFISRNYVV